MADEPMVVAENAGDTGKEAAQEVTQEQSETEQAEQEAVPAVEEVQKKAESIARSLVAKKLKEAGFTKKGDLDAFKKWQESQMTPEQKESAALLAAQEQANEYKAKLDALERREAVRAAGVSPDYVDFVAFEAGKSVDDVTDFGAALKKYIGENAQFTAQPTPKNTQLPICKATAPVSDVERHFFDRNPQLQSKKE